MTKWKQAQLRITRPLTSTIAAVTVFSSIDLLISVLKAFLSSVNAVSSLTDVDLNVSRALQTSIDVQSNLSSIDLLITTLIEFLSSVSAQSDISSIDLNILRELQSVVDSVSVVGNVDVNVIRNLASVISSGSTLTEAQLNVLRNLLSTINSATALSAITLLTAVMGEILSTGSVDKSIQRIVKDLTQSDMTVKSASSYSRLNKSDVLTVKRKAS